MRKVNEKGLPGYMLHDRRGAIQQKDGIKRAETTALVTEGIDLELELGTRDLSVKFTTELLYRFV